MTLKYYGKLLYVFYECFVEDYIFSNPLREELGKYIFRNPTSEADRCFRIHSIEDLIAITTMICKLIWLEICDSGEDDFKGFKWNTSIYKYSTRKVRGGRHNKRDAYVYIYRNKTINFCNLVEQLGLRYKPTDAERFWYYGIFQQCDEDGEFLYDLNNCEFDRLYLFDALTKDNEAILFQKLKDKCPNYPYYEGKSCKFREPKPFHFNDFSFFSDFEDGEHRPPSPEWFIKTLLETTSKSEPD